MTQVYSILLLTLKVKIVALTFASKRPGTRNHRKALPVLGDRSYKWRIPVNSHLTMGIQINQNLQKRETEKQMNNHITEFEYYFTLKYLNIKNKKRKKLKV